MLLILVPPSSKESIYKNYPHCTGTNMAHLHSPAACVSAMEMRDVRSSTERRRRRENFAYTTFCIQFYMKIDRGNPTFFNEKQELRRCRLVFNHRALMDKRLGGSKAQFCAQKVDGQRQRRDQKLVFMKTE